MASYYEGLPVFRTAMDLSVTLDRVVRNFSRYHKYTLGSRLRETAIESVLQVARCNARENRAAALVRLCAVAEEMKLLVNMGREVQAFQGFKDRVGRRPNQKHGEQVMEQAVSLARQAEGWRRSISGSTARGPEPVRSTPQGAGT